MAIDKPPAAEFVPLEKLKPWAKNPRKNDSAVTAVANSITRFGFGAPLLARRETGEVIAGHTRLKAAIKLRLTEVPVRYLDLTETEAHALAIADNRVGEIAEWDATVLADVLRELEESGARIDDLGFDESELAEVLGTAAPDETYTTKIEGPVYAPTMEYPPPISDLYDTTKTAELLAEVNAADLPPEVATFLRLAAERHTAFNFRNIAEYYAHAPTEIQNLMERSALVIVDFNKAIENGFVLLTERLIKLTDANRDGDNG